MNIWPFKQKRMRVAHLGGPDTVDGRSFQQWLAGVLGQVQENEIDLRLGAKNYTRTWLVTGYPEGPAYLQRMNRLLRFHVSDSDPRSPEIHVRLTYHLLPSALPQGVGVKWQRRRQRGMSQDGAAEGTPDPETTKALDAYEDIFQAVAFNDDRVMEIWMGITVTTPDLDTMARMEQKLLQEVATMNMAVTPLFKEQIQGLAFSHVLGIRQDQLLKAWPGRYTHTEPLSYLCPFLHGTLSEGKGIYVGHEIDDVGFQHGIYCDFTRGSGPQNWIVVGMSGEGKSTWIKGTNLGLLLEGYVVFQYDANGEYGDFCEYVGGTDVDMTADSGNYFEPLVIPPPVGDLAYDRGRFARASQLFHCVIKGLAPDISPAEKDMADKIMMMVYATVGVDPDDPSTWNQAASIHDWWQIVKEHPDPVAKALRDKLSLYFDGSQRLFRQPLSPDWDGAQFVRIRVSDSVSNNAADERIAGVKTLLANNYVWQWVVANKHKGLQYVMIRIDEGQRVLRDPEMASHTYHLATDGRKHNAGLTIAANDINVFWETTAGRGMWENANLHCLFYMQESGIKKAAENGLVPETVREHLRTFSQTHQFMITRDSRRWTRARMELPPVELDLAKTRGLRQPAS